MFLSKMKVLLLIAVISAVTAGFPVSENQEREERSASGSNESPSPFYGPFGPYPPFLDPRYPWWRYCPPFPIPFNVPPPNGQ